MVKVTSRVTENPVSSLYVVQRRVIPTTQARVSLMLICTHQVYILNFERSTLEAVLTIVFAGNQKTYALITVGTVTVP